MLVYCLLFTIIIVYIHRESISHAKSNVCWIFFLIWIIMSFRDYSVGTDTASYIEEYLSGTSFLRSTDFGFARYVEFLASLNFSSRLFLVITSSIILFPVFYYIYKFTQSKNLATLLYLTIGTFSMHMTGIRQSMAMGLALLGYTLSTNIDRKYMKYIPLLLLVYLSTTIHGTSVICYLYLLLMIISEKDFNISKKMQFLLLITPILSMIFSSYFSHIANVFMISKYQDYELGAANVNPISFYVIPYSIFLYVTWLQRKQGLVNRIERFEYLCSFAYAICSAASMYMPILIRMSFYFSLPMLSLVAGKTISMENSNRNIIKPILIIVCIAYFLISSSGGILHIDNYQFNLD